MLAGSWYDVVSPFVTRWEAVTTSIPLAWYPPLIHEGDMGIPREVDHLVYAVPDLAAGVDELEARFGVRASPGGPHPGRATRNHLLSLGDSSYLEIIGPDPEQDDPGFPRPFGIDDLGTGGLVTWAIHPRDLEGVVERARKAGYHPGDIMSMSRQSPGGLLEWRLTMRPHQEAGGIVPFLIDWGETPSPAHTSAKGCSLLDLRAQHPKPEEVTRLLGALDVSLDVTAAPNAAVIARLQTPNGEIELR